MQISSALLAAAWPAAMPSDGIIMMCRRLRRSRLTLLRQRPDFESDPLPVPGRVYERFGREEWEGGSEPDPGPGLGGPGP
jgi:hypothetical protein